MVQCSKSTRSENSFVSQIPLTHPTALKITVDHTIDLKSVYFTVKIHGTLKSLRTLHVFSLTVTISSFPCAHCALPPLSHLYHKTIYNLYFTERFSKNNNLLPNAN